MTKIKNTFYTVIFVIAFCFVIALFCPFLREPFLLLLQMFWSIFELFFLEDSILSVFLYITIAALFALGGLVISCKTEQKIWAVIAIIVDIVGLITMVGFYN